MAHRVVEPVQWTRRAANAEKEGRGFPWKEWMDGSVWRLVQGEDYIIRTQSMKARLYRQAKREERRVRLLMDTAADPETITFQFIP